MSHVVILHIGNDSNDLEVSRALHTRNSEVNSNRTLSLGEHFFHERLIDDGNRKRGRRVLRRDSTSLNDTLPYDVEELRCNANPCGADTIIRSRFRTSLNIDALTPVVSL